MKKKYRTVYRSSYVVIPIYNEERSLPIVLTAIKRYAPSAGILVVDDGSQDKSHQCARRFGAIAVRLRSNKGSGCAVQVGLKLVKDRCKHVVLFDGDGQHDARVIPRLIKELNDGSDMVIASRYITGGSGGSAFLRRIGTTILSLGIYILYKKRIYDPTSGFRALTGRAVQVLSSRYPTMFSEPETIVMAFDRRLVIKEIPVSMQPRMFGSSSISFFKGCKLMTYMVYVLLKRYFSHKK